MGEPDEREPAGVDEVVDGGADERGDDAVGRVADELYGGSPDDFVRKRGERVKQARADGDRALAKAIGDLRRPTRSAWTVNLLARGAPDELGALLDLGEALRAAQESLSGADLRRLSGERHRAVETLVRRSVQLAGDAEFTPNESVSREVGQALQVALADPDVAARVRGGRLATIPEYGGLNPFAVGSADPSAIPGAASAPEVARDEDEQDEQDGDGREERRRKAEREARLEQARAALADAARATVTAEQALADAQGEARAAADELSGLREQLESAERRAGETEQAVATVQRQLDERRAAEEQARGHLHAATAAR